MQPDPGVAKQSRWGKGLLIGGIILMMIGLVLFFSQMEPFEEISNPEKSNVVAFAVPDDLGRAVDVDVEQACHVAWATSDAVNITIEISTENGTAIEQTSCGHDVEAFSGNGTVFRRVGSWQLQAGLHSVDMGCDGEDCEAGSAWLVDHDEAVGALFDQTGLWISFGSCLIGICLAPLGTLLIMMVPKAQQGRTFVVVDGDQGSPAVVDVAGQAQVGHLQTAGVDSSGSVVMPTQGKIAEDADLLTTDQVYALVHGSGQARMDALMGASKNVVEGDPSGVPDPFPAASKVAPSKKPIINIDESDQVVGAESLDGDSAVEDSGWKSWDEG